MVGLVRAGWGSCETVTVSLNKVWGPEAERSLNLSRDGEFFVRGGGSWC